MYFPVFVNKTNVINQYHFFLICCFVSFVAVWLYCNKQISRYSTDDWQTWLWLNHLPLWCLHSLNKWRTICCDNPPYKYILTQYMIQMQADSSSAHPSTLGCSVVTPSCGKWLHRQPSDFSSRPFSLCKSVILNPVFSLLLNFLGVIKNKTLAFSVQKCMYVLIFFPEFSCIFSTGESCFLLKIHYFGGLYIVDLCRFIF